MIRQYRAGRHTYVETARGSLPVGTIPVGTILKPSGRFAPLIVEAWLPRDYSTWCATTRKACTKRITGGHLAIVRCLASGKRMTVSDARLLHSEETFH